MAGFITLKSGATTEELVRDLIKQTLTRLATIIIEIPPDEEREYEKANYSIYKSLTAALEITDVNQAISNLLDTYNTLREWERSYFVQDRHACSRLAADIAECLALAYDIKYRMV